MLAHELEAALVVPRGDLAPVAVAPGLHLHGSEPSFATQRAAAWNERAIRLYERLGFREVARETRRFELVGEHEFVRMERAA